MFERYRELMDAGEVAEAERYKLYGVRLDTSGSLRDQSVPPLGDPALDLGVNPRLVFNVRQALDSAWESWDLPAAWRRRAQEYCQAVKIVVSGGFNPEKIRRFEKLGVPVDIYAVGSSLFNNDGANGDRFHRRRGARQGARPVGGYGQGRPQAARQPRSGKGLVEADVRVLLKCKGAAARTAPTD